MHELNCKISGALEQALLERQKLTGETAGHIVRAALADYLQIGHSTLFQISSINALVEGIYQGEISVDQLKEHGDFGLGTFDSLDGEMVALDGHFHQVTADGKVREVPGDVGTPFAVVTFFQPGNHTDFLRCASYADLQAQIDELRHSDNTFYAIRVDGCFDFVRTRAMHRTADGVPLVEAAAHQPEFEYSAISGSVVGFWSPSYVSTLNVPGYHLHFISEDRSAGGHVLELSGSDLKLRIEEETALRLALPENEAFLRADLTRDVTEDLDKAER
ncbi:acetolactate decarboxylase [Candidatus Methylospira mobilis]|uniref:acetolactate decarboxylase n=1 Tax=Candidatus Methylospira mobilis TaxID=1808979 RepID=UPI0028E5C297|nr:acetolactate decarboxylase [Candidatus Methylospira mobilis]WNV05571.1 acetolactate decarboxylase [Candidatus Methylospira mobilis]